MTDIIFSFDTEDFTSSVAADAIYREAEILRKAGIKGGFCIVGLLAGQLEKWERTDVLEALKNHEIGTHSYGHSLHPTINEYTDLEQFGEAYNELMNQEQSAIEMIKHATGVDKMIVACPPGNQKSYVAMYGYADMNIPIYADTYCDTEDGRGVFYCNIYHVKYTWALEQLMRMTSEDEIEQILDRLANLKRAVIYTHPNMANFSEFWDKVNYYKTNNCTFGNWNKAQRRDEAETEEFYRRIAVFAERIKNDPRFRITSYSELASELREEGERKITKHDIKFIRDSLESDFFPVTYPCSLSISDIFLACRDFLLGKREHVCGKVYGFLDTPFSVNKETIVTASEIIESASKINIDRFLPVSVNVGDKLIGPAEWLRAAMAVICGEKEVTSSPATQMPCLDVLPAFADLTLKGWVQSDDFKDEYLTKRLKLQAWTMRFKK